MIYALVILVIISGLIIWFLIYVYKNSFVDKKFDSAYFNNLVTPIAAVISVLLFAIIAVQQNLLLKVQNDLIVSQSLKPHYESRLRNVFNRIDTISFTIDSKIELVFDLGYTAQHKVMHIKSSEQYKEDLEKVQKGIKLNLDYLKSRSYFKDIEYLGYFFATDGHLKNILELIYLIKDSDLHSSDKKFFYREIESKMHNVTASYFSILSEGNLMIPYLLYPINLKLPIQYSNKVPTMIDKINDQTTLNWHKISELDYFFYMNSIIESLDIERGDPEDVPPMFSSKPIIE